jgi:Histidine kinase
MISGHAEVGARLVTIDSGAAREALQTISTISRDALNDLRRLLRHMRTTTTPTIYSPIPDTARARAVDTVGVTP